VTPIQVAMGLPVESHHDMDRDMKHRVRCIVSAIDLIGSGGPLQPFPPIPKPLFSLRFSQSVVGR